jgi:hypothetical protein
MMDNEITIYQEEGQAVEVRLDTDRDTVSEQVGRTKTSD